MCQFIKGSRFIFIFILNSYNRKLSQYFEQLAKMFLTVKIQILVYSFPEINASSYLSVSSANKSEFSF